MGNKPTLSQPLFHEKLVQVVVLQRVWGLKLTLDLRLTIAEVEETSLD